jgi:hypothetical protein
MYAQHVHGTRTQQDVDKYTGGTMPFREIHTYVVSVQAVEKPFSQPGWRDVNTTVAQRAGDPAEALEVVMAQLREDAEQRRWKHKPHSFTVAMIPED